MTRFGSSSSGRSLALWTAMSISPATSARSSAVTNIPSPIGASFARTSPSETIVLTSTGAPLARSRAATISLCTSARRDPRVPSRSGLAEPTVNSRVWQHRQGWRRGDHVAYDQRRRRADRCLVRDASDAIQRADDALLIRQRRIADHGSRARAPDGPRQNGRHLGQVGPRHQDHECVGGKRKLAEAVERALALGGGDRERRGDSAQRHGYAGGRRRSQRCCNPGNDDDLDAGARQIAQLLATTPEDERIATLESHHGMARMRQFDEPRGDGLLARVVVTGAFAHVLEPGVGTAKGKRLGRDEGVVQHVIGVRQQLASLEREQVGIARTGADEGDAAGSTPARLADGHREVGRLIAVSAAEKVANLGVDDAPINVRLLGDRHASGAELAPHVSDQSHERPPLAPQPALDASTQSRREVRAFARCRDRDEQRIPFDDGGRDEAALCRAVDDVDEDARFFSLLPAAPVDVRVFAGIHDEAGADEIAGLVLLRGYDPNNGSGFAERGGLFLRELAFAQNNTRLVHEVEEDRVVPHAVASSFFAASRSTFATSGRVNSGGSSLPSSRSLRTAVPLNVRWEVAGCGQVRDDAIPPQSEQ